LNFDASTRLKVRGMAISAGKNNIPLQKARKVAESLALARSGTVTSDDVSRELSRLGENGNLGAAAGSIFKTGRWEFTGDRVMSKRITNHAREIKVWKLKA
jgi:hypothetical protein